MFHNLLNAEDIFCCMVLYLMSKSLTQVQLKNIYLNMYIMKSKMSH